VRAERLLDRQPMLLISDAVPFSDRARISHQRLDQDALLQPVSKWSVSIGVDGADEAIAAAAGMSVQDIEDMYRLLAIAKYDDRYVIPKAHTELAGRLMEQQGACGLDFDGGPGNCGAIADPTAEQFMLTDEPPALDIIEMLGDRRQDANGAS